MHLLILFLFNAELIAETSIPISCFILKYLLEIYPLYKN